MSQCSSWKSIGHIKGGIPVSKGVFCQVGIGAAEGNEWKQCVDGTTKPASPAVMYNGICPGSISADDIAAARKAAGLDRSLQDTPDAAISQCSSWKSKGLFKGRVPVPIGGVWCQVGPNEAEGNAFFECVDGITKPTGGSLLYTGMCPSSVTDGARSLQGMAVMQDPRDEERSLQDTTDAAMSQCSSWKSIGHIKGGIPVSKGVFCQVGIGAAEGNEWKQCVDGTTKPASPAVMYNGICPGSISADDIAAARKAAGLDRSLQDTPLAAISQCSSWKSHGNIKGRPNFAGGVFCQVGPQAAENEWKECVDGTTKPTGGALLYTGLCPGTMPEEVGDIHV